VDRFDAMQIFVRVVEKGSFSAVAKERGIGQPAVSKQISALENELGTELIHRTSRSIALTEPGRDFYESALHILDDFENATSRVGRGQTAPKGLIRVTVPPTFARLHMVSKLAAFFAAYPDLAVEMSASEGPSTRITGRTQALSVCRFCRERLSTAVELWFRTRREARYPHRSLSYQRH
jgi:DNA-binding transcriptional LysR family regulator